MLFMVIESFKDGTARAAGARFPDKGRLLPAGAEYVASWMETSGARCFQLMEAKNVEALTPWLRAWEDLVDFEIVHVESSANFWAKRNPK